MNSDDMYIKDICQGMTPYQCSQQIKSDTNLELNRAKAAASVAKPIESQCTSESLGYAFCRAYQALKSLISGY